MRTTLASSNEQAINEAIADRYDPKMAQELTASLRIAMDERPLAQRNLDAVRDALAAAPFRPAVPATWPLRRRVAVVRVRLELDPAAYGLQEAPSSKTVRRLIRNLDSS